MSRAIPTGPVAQQQILAALLDAAVPVLVAPYHLRRFYMALADRAVTGTGLVTINTAGDSITVGVGADGSATPTLPASDPTYRTQGYLAQLRKLLSARYGGYVGEGFINVRDPGGRGVQVSGTIFVYAPMKGMQRLNAAAQTLTITPTESFTELDVYTWDGSNGTIGWTIDGNAQPSLVNTTNAPTSTNFSKTTITGLTDKVQAIVFTGANGNTVYIGGVVPRKLASGVLVNRMAHSGDTSANFIGLDSGAPTATQAAILAASYANVGRADLVIVMLGVNDYVNQADKGDLTKSQPGNTAAGYKSNMQTFCNALVAQGSCVLLVGEPETSPTVAGDKQSDYRLACRDIAINTDHVSFVDSVDVWGDYVNGGAQANGFYTTASVHPKRVGHGSLARDVIFPVLSRPAVLLPS